jgi:3',5'-cyclic AMP phosphodiesterase CpdA
MIRLAHLSDIHISSRKLEWRFHDYLNKRFAGWINHRWLGRGFRFRRADDVLRKLFVELQNRDIDHVVFSGDATAMGFESELRRATEIMGLDNGLELKGIAVPGNHDYATKAAARSGLFERYFSSWQEGERIDQEIYPFAQKVKDVWLVGFNTASGNTWPWDATGRAGKTQIERLGLLLDRLGPEPKIMVTHYPVCLPNGRFETAFRVLRDVREVVRVAGQGGVCLWLHGHRHRAFYIAEPKHASFPVICAGSATQTRLWSYGEYVLNGSTCEVLRREFDLKSGEFRDCQEAVLELPVAVA